METFTKEETRSMRMLDDLAHGTHEKKEKRAHQDKKSRANELASEARNLIKTALETSDLQGYRLSSVYQPTYSFKQGGETDFITKSTVLGSSFDLIKVSDFKPQVLSYLCSHIHPNEHYRVNVPINGGNAHKLVQLVDKSKGEAPIKLKEILEDTLVTGGYQLIKNKY